jgi:hypothetical protein
LPARAKRPPPLVGQCDIDATVGAATLQEQALAHRSLSQARLIAVTETREARAEFGRRAKAIVDRLGDRRQEIYRLDFALFMAFAVLV